MFGKKISVDSELYVQLKQCAEAAGYATPEEFAIHALEKAVDRLQGRHGQTDEPETAAAEHDASGPAAVETSPEAAAATGSSPAENTEARYAETEPVTDGDREAITHGTTGLPPPGDPVAEHSGEPEQRSASQT